MVDLAVVHENVRVRVRRGGDVALSDLRADLRPAFALVVEQADPAMPEVVWREHRDARIAAGSPDCDPERVRRSEGDERGGGIAVFPRWEPLDDGRVQVIGKSNPARTPCLRDLGANEPRLALLVQVADGGRVQLAADLKSGQAELDRRAAAKAREKKRTDYLTMQAKLAVEGSIHERVARMEEAERVRAEKQEARTRKLGEKRAIEAQKRHAQLVKAGRAYEPVGGWDREASDALAALFSSSWLWESSLARRAGSDHLTIEQVIRAWWALSLIAENGGGSVTFAQNRPPRGGISASFSENDLRHLHDLGLITLQKAGGQFTLGRGPRLEELRRTFAEEFKRRVTA